MGFRFRKSVKIIPGVRLNLGKKSAGISMGGKGIRVSVNTSGRTTTTVGIPSSGMSWTTSTSPHAKRHSGGGRTYSSNEAEKPYIFGSDIIAKLSDNAFQSYYGEVKDWVLSLTTDDDPTEIEAACAAAEDILREADIRRHYARHTFADFLPYLLLVCADLWLLFQSFTATSTTLSVITTLGTFALAVLGFLWLRADFREIEAQNEKVRRAVEEAYRENQTVDWDELSTKLESEDAI